MQTIKLASAMKWSLVFALGVGTGIVAQTVGDLPQRVEQKRADLSGAPGMEVVASIIELKPGEESRLHTHNGIEAAYVIQGATVQSPGQPPGALPTGATLLNLRDVKHGAFKVTGDTPLRYFAVHVVDKGKPLYEYGN
jgi:quercetin dioxygenase-like cupin family protein